MKLIIDTEEIKTQEISKSLFFYLLFLKNSGEVNLKEIAKEGQLEGYTKKEGENTYSLNQEGSNIITKVLIGSKSEIKGKSDKKYKEIAQEMMEIFPNGKKDGTNKYWRGSIDQVANKLNLLEKIINKELEKEEVIKATEEYVKSFDTDYMYMRTLPYFILKGIVVEEGIDWESELLNIIENRKINEDYNQ